MPYNESDVQRALARTMNLMDTSQVGEIENIDEFVLIQAKDAFALREVALARHDKDGAAVMSLTLEALSRTSASYGPETERVRIPRAAYDAMGRPPRLLVRIDGEHG